MKTINHITGLIIVLSSGFLTSVTAENIDKSSTAEQSITVASVSAPVTSDSRIVEILPEDFKPAFTRSTVIKLNAIVEQSYTIIREFDNFKKDLNNIFTMSLSGDATPMELSKHQLIAIDSLAARSKTALKDMKDAIVDLKSSNEHYNPAVLAGMVIFVESVEEEINHFYQNRKNT